MKQEAVVAAPDGRCARLHAVQVVLLLKSSDRVAHDVCHAFDACGGAPPDLARSVRYALALRKWVALKPEREFRCFVSARELVGEVLKPLKPVTRNSRTGGAHQPRQPSHVAY